MVKESGGKDSTVQIRLNDPAGKVLGSHPVNGGDMRKVATAIWDIIEDRKGKSRMTSVFLEIRGRQREVRVTGGRVDVPAIYTTLGRMLPGR